MKLILGLCALLFLPFIGQSQSDYPLILTDGYFQAATASQPVHLVHTPPYPSQWLMLDEPVHIWYILTLRQGETNPCDEHSQEECTMRIHFESLSDPTYSYNMDQNIRIYHGKLDISYGIPVARNTPLGPAKFVWTVQKDGKILFSHEIAVEVH